MAHHSLGYELKFTRVVVTQQHPEAKHSNWRSRQNVERDAYAARNIARKTGQTGAPVIRIGSKGIAPAGPHAVLQDANELSASGRYRVVFSYLDPVPQRAQLFHLGLRNAALDQEPVALVAVAGVVHGLLGAHVEVYEVGEQLSVTLGLHRAAHHTEDSPECSVPGGEAGDYGVQWTLAGGEGVRVALV